MRLEPRGLLMESIRKIAEDCKAAAKPYDGALAEIDAGEPPEPVLVPYEDQ